MASDAPLVTVVVLSYNRPACLAECLRALTAQTHPNVRVVVVDNRSPASQAIAAEVARFPAMRLVRNPSNLGFAAGMNVGIRQATGEYICLTEDDIVLAPDYLSRVLAAAESRPDVGLASGVQYNRVARTVRCAGGRFRLGGVYEFTLLHAGAAETPETEPFPVGFVPGSMVFARADLLRRLNGFRNDFFMYGEDVELCARVTRLGLRILVVPAARADHFDPPDGAGVPSWLEEIKIRNFVALYVLHAPAAVLPAFVARYGVGGVARALARDPRAAWIALKAWARAFVALPGLLADRRRIRRSNRIAAWGAA